MTESQDSLVRVVVTRRVGRSLADWRNRIRTEPNHAERHCGSGEVVAAYISHSAGADEGIYVPPECPRGDRGCRLLWIAGDGSRRQELMDRQNRDDTRVKMAILLLHRKTFRKDGPSHYETNESGMVVG